MFFNILGREEKNEERRTVVTTLAEGIVIVNGNMEASGDVVVEGRYQGRLVTPMGITVGESGRIDGSVEAKKIILRGIIEGDVECDEIEVMDGARISGKITTGNFIIGNGGVFEGIIKKKDV